MKNFRNMPNLLKSELHCHIDKDPEDSHFINYSAIDLINQAKKLDFKILGITCHNYVYSNPETDEYAKKNGILLLHGAELNLESKHTLVYNITNEQIKKIKTFQDLKELKQIHPELFIIAPHPFHYFPNCLKNNILKYPDLFDAWEFSFFYTSWFNPNKKTAKLAKKHHQQLVGNSDVHFLKDLGKTYTLIELTPELSTAELSTELSPEPSAEKFPNQKDIFQAIKDGNLTIITTPLTTLECFQRLFTEIISAIKKKIITRKAKKHGTIHFVSDTA